MIPAGEGAPTSGLSRPKVLVVTPWFPCEAQPTAGVFVRDHALLAQRVADVIVLHLEAVRQGQPVGVAMDTTSNLTSGLTVVRARYVDGRGPRQEMRRLLAALRAVRALAAQGYRPDLVHGHVFWIAPAAWLLARICGARLAFSEHASAFPLRKIPRRRLRVTRRLYRTAATVMPVSAFLQQSMEEMGITADYRILANPVDTSLFHPLPNAAGTPTGLPLRLLFVGGLGASDIKNVGGMLRSLSRVDEVDWNLEIAGDGDGRHDHEEATRQLGIDGRVTFRGGLQRSEVAAAMQQADALLLMSPLETFSCVVAEALCSGLPVIATDTGAIGEMIRRTSGGVVIESTEELPDALTSMVAGQLPDRQEIAASAQSFLAMHALEDQLSDTYSEIMARPATGTGRLWPIVTARAGLFERYRVARRRWRQIDASIVGARGVDQAKLRMSRTVDALRMAATGDWIPRPLFAVDVLDPATGLLGRARAGTDDLYLLFPGREQDVERAILDPLRPGDVFVDVGANVGFYTLRAATLVGPTGLVLSIEPMPATRAALEVNVALNKLANVTIIANAVSDEAATHVSLFHPPGRGGLARASDDATAGVMAQTTTLDVACRDLSHIRVLKLDIEGMELRALRSGSATLARTDVVVCERDQDADEIAGLLRREGFDVRDADFTSYCVANRPSPLSSSPAAE